MEDEHHGDMWGEMEVQENIIPQLLDHSSHAVERDEDLSERKKVRFTANSTLAVYPSEKSLSEKEGESSDEEYDEDDYDEVLIFKSFSFVIRFM